VAEEKDAPRAADPTPYGGGGRCGGGIGPEEKREFKELTQKGGELKENPMKRMEKKTPIWEKKK